MSTSLPSVTVFSELQSEPSSSSSAPYAKLIENAVDVEEIDVNLYKSRQLWTPTGARGVFGGQVVAQALRAATKTVNPEFSIHSLHSYFILPGNNQIPILYQVERVREGKSYSTRFVRAVQRGRAIFIASFSFSIKAEGITLQHQLQMPKVPEPEILPNDEERVKSFITHPDVDITPQYREYLKIKVQERSPMDYRNTFVPKPEEYSNKAIKSTTQTLWFKTNGALSDDATLHQCVVAYASDNSLIGTAVRANGLGRYQIGMMASLDHSMWFHAPFRADEWLLYEMESPRTNDGRGIAFGRIYRRDGTLVVSVAQEGILRLSLKEQKRRAAGTSSETKMKAKL